MVVLSESIFKPTLWSCDTEFPSASVVVCPPLKPALKPSSEIEPEAPRRSVTLLPSASVILSSVSLVTASDGSFTFTLTVCLSLSSTLLPSSLVTEVLSSSETLTVPFSASILTLSDLVVDEFAVVSVAVRSPVIVPRRPLSLMDTLPPMDSVVLFQSAPEWLVVTRPSSVAVFLLPSMFRPPLTPTVSLEPSSLTVVSECSPATFR